MLPPHAETNGTTSTSEKIDFARDALVKLLDAPSAAFVPRHFRGTKAGARSSKASQRPRSGTEMRLAHIESGSDCVLGQKCARATHRRWRRSHY